jgi:hypothetical protein
MTVKARWQVTDPGWLRRLTHAEWQLLLAAAAPTLRVQAAAITRGTRSRPRHLHHAASGLDEQPPVCSAAIASSRVFADLLSMRPPSTFAFGADDSGD